MKTDRTSKGTDNVEPLVVLLDGHESGVAGEEVFGAPLGGDRFEVRNSPFYAYNLNYGDIVLAPFDRQRKTRVIREVVEPSGHETFRLLMLDGTPAKTRRKVLDAITTAGATYESAGDEHAALYSLDIGPEATFDTLVELLDRFESEGVISYETGRQGTSGFVA